ncbi:CapA family protein [Catenulispora sp. NF23]|uniref:CapA family protein n=1 Tax=Catenulispora pinistramenti TaxID=2705254 RepID=A0ABS5L6M5_9ACTN|nr:CapA family protein [Catenulispora pinistramenti]MBS2535711.1 CapA family protein [Catenulispora pinistramenti]MBS2553885.1 CapA family protein [Catenulispora pinistramenti]
MSDEISFLGVGDLLIDRAAPRTVFRHVAEVIQAADIAFANCEQMYSDRLENPVSRHPSHSDPDNIDALEFAGFDVLSLANNHTMDWGGDALIDTLSRLRARGFQPVGAGADLAEARRPVCLEAKGVKVGFLAYGNTGPETYAAGEGNAGYAPVHAWTEHETVDRQAATPKLIRSGADPAELARMVEDIKALKQTCHAVVVSFHWGVHFAPRVIPDYCYEMGRAAVDAGADLVLGTHPHILKGVETYRGKVIFYSTGNFALELGPSHSADENAALALKKLHKLYGVRPDPGYPTYPMHPESKASIIVKASISRGGIERVGYIPVHINRHAEPEIVGQLDPRGQQVFDYLRSVTESEQLTCVFRWYGDEVVIDTSVSA